MQRVLNNIDREQLLRALRFLRRFSPSWILGLAVASFILASMLSLYLSFALLPVGKSTRPSKRETGSEVVRTEGKKLNKADIDIIVGRNIFNSEGKLGDSIEGGGARGPRAGDKLVKSDLPLKLTGVISAGDPYNGLAMFENTDKKKISSYMVGDSIQDGVELSEIYDDRVILLRNGGREYIEISKFEMPSGRRKGPARQGNGPLALDRIASRAPPEAYREEGFERKGSTIKLTEEFKRNLLSPDRLTKVLQDAKAEPNMVGGELKGFKLTRIRENSDYEKAGFQNGDIVEEINGIPLRDAGGAIKLLNQLKNEKEIEVRVNKNGVITTMSIQIQ